MAVWENIQKSPRCHTHRGLFYFINQAAKVLPGGGMIEIRGLVCPNIPAVLIPEITYFFI